MKERPILFSAPMVRAILEGRKTQTRRVVKWKPRESGLNLGFSGLQLGLYNECNPKSGFVLRSRGAGGCWNDRTYPLHCPYGAPGDRLWVREAFAYSVKDPDSSRNDEYTEEQYDAVYRATQEHEGDWTNYDENGKQTPIKPRWRPGIHMPRWASRIDLEVTGVRVERLHDISDDAARAEGVDHAAPHPYGERWDDDREDPREVGYPLAGASFARDNFRRLWSSINGAGSWDANPWVWVVEFKRIEAQERAA